MSTKPRLRFFQGLWYCFTPVPFFSMGVGRTPMMAYLDWQYT